jgi:hypothetical protein
MPGLFLPVTGLVGNGVVRFLSDPTEDDGENQEGSEEQPGPRRQHSGSTDSGSERLAMREKVAGGPV